MSHTSGIRLLMRHRRASGAMFTIAMLCAIGVSTWRPRAQNQEPAAPNAVRKLDPKVSPRSKSGASDRGATYHWLEERVVRVTSRFVDAVAVTERIAGGDLKTRLTDLTGRELATLAIDRLGSADDVLTFRAMGDDVPMRATGRSGTQPDLDWGNRQAYTLWNDRATAPDVELEWQGELMRSRVGRPVDFQRDTLEVRTEWSDGFAAAALRSAGQRPHPKTGAPSRGTSLESRLTRDNLEVGRSRWYPEEQVYVWSIPGLTIGYIDPVQLKDIGGWTFTPDLAWTNVQTYAFHYFHTLVATQGFVSEAQEPSPPWLARVIDAIAPTVHANEPGCDGLHWLDGSIFRLCCDVHDKCYEKYGCTYKSWWEWYSSWKCTMCNIVATICIATRYPPYSPAYP
jgi:hypothetical protein